MDSTICLILGEHIISVNDCSYRREQFLNRALIVWHAYSLSKRKRSFRCNFFSFTNIPQLRFSVCLGFMETRLAFMAFDSQWQNSLTIMQIIWPKISFNETTWLDNMASLHLAQDINMYLSIHERIQKLQISNTCMPRLIELLSITPPDDIPCIFLLPSSYSNAESDQITNSLVVCLWRNYDNVFFEQWNTSFNLE